MKDLQIWRYRTLEDDVLFFGKVSQSIPSSHMTPELTLCIQNKPGLKKEERESSPPLPASLLSVNSGQRGFLGTKQLDSISPEVMR